MILAVQRNGTYLESIFSAGDVRKQLHTESANFMDIDAEGRKTMCESPKYQEVVVIEKVQKAVDVPVIKQVEVPQVQTLEQIVEIPQIQAVERIVEIPQAAVGVSTFD